MNEEMMALGRRAVASKGWRWMPGMRCDRGAGWFRIVDGYTIETPSLDTLPDLTDPATLGCLRALVTEAYADPKKLWNGYVEVHRDQHAVFHLEQAVHDEDGYLVWNCICFGETKAEVLVRALEAAP